MKTKFYVTRINVKRKKNTTDHVFCNTDPEARVKILVPPLQSRETRTAQTTE